MNVYNILPDDLAKVRLRPINCPVDPKCPSSRAIPELHKLIASVPNAVSGYPYDKARTARNWRDVKNRCASHPSEAARLDKKGRTCLHAACAKKPPPDVVTALLKACGRNGATVGERDNHGRTPLAIAVSMTSSVSVVEVLLRSNGKAAAVPDFGGSLPLHLACSSNVEDMVALVKLLLGSYREGAAKESHEGKTPLHMAVEGGAPVEVVRMLVEASPEAVVMDSCWHTPLALAIKHHSPVDVFRILVNGNPASRDQKDKHGLLPLLRAVEHQSPPRVVELLCGSRDHVLAKDRIGRTALHLALERSPGTEGVVRTLLKWAPEVSVARSKGGKTPLDLAYDRYARMVRGHSEMTGGMEVDYNNVLVGGRARHMWNVLCLLLRAAYHNTVECPLPNGKAWRVLHAAVTTDAPMEVIRTALALKPNHIREPDEEGKLPLSLALSSATSSGAVVDLLLDSYPEAASVPDGDGRFPLSVAAELFPDFVSGGALMRLVFAYPDALRSVDPKGGLYPFMLAAVCKERTTKREYPKSVFKKRPELELLVWVENNKELAQLTAVYELLLAGPDLVMSNAVC